MDTFDLIRLVFKVGYEYLSWWKLPGFIPGRKAAALKSQEMNYSVGFSAFPVSLDVFIASLCTR